MLATGEVPPDIQERVQQALTDLELVRRLEEIRAQSGTVWVTDSVRGLYAQADQEYAAAFRQAGIDLDALPANEAAEQITARQSSRGRDVCRRSTTGSPSEASTKTHPGRGG